MRLRHIYTIRRSVKIRKKIECKKWRYDKVITLIHWHLCHKLGFPYGSKKYVRSVDSIIAALEDEAVKLLCDFSIQTENESEHNKPDIVVIEKVKTCYVIDVLYPFDTRTEKKEIEKKDAYYDLEYKTFKEL